jgi:hypothetical protein
MMSNSSTDFFRTLELDAADAARHVDAFDRLRAGDLQGILIHNVYAPHTLAPVVARLERHDPPFLKTWFPEAFRAFFYGENLNLAHPDLSSYFREAARFNEQLRELFPPGLGLAEHVADILAQLDHARPFQAPPGPHPGQQYMFTTLRAHLEGGYIPAHCDNEQALRPTYRHLHSLIEPHMMSFVLALTMPEAGGALEIFNHRAPELAQRPMNDDRAPKVNLAGLDSVSFRLAPGSMIVVDSGRLLHRLTPVVGPRTRWTACSFMARSRRGDAVYCWG